MSCESNFRMAIVSKDSDSMQLFFKVLKSRANGYNLPCSIFIDEEWLYMKNESDFYFAAISGETNGKFYNLLNKKFETPYMKNIKPDSIDKLCREFNVAVEVYCEQHSSSTQGHLIINNLGEVVVNDETSIKTKSFQKPWKKGDILK